MWIPPHPPLVRACNARQACCNHESFHALSYHEWLASHSSIGSSQSVHLNCGKGTVDRCGPRSFEHAMQGTCCNHESVHALSFHERLSSHGSLGSSQSVHLNCGKGAWIAAAPLVRACNSRHGCCKLHWTLPRTRFPQVACPSQLDPRCSSSFSSRLRHSLSWNAKARRYLASREKAELFAATT